jgi:hypothetical protein
MNDISKKIKETYRIVNFLLSKNLDEKFSDIFDLAAELELPVGISRFGDNESWLKSYNELNKMMIENSLIKDFEKYLKETSK